MADFALAVRVAMAGATSAATAVAAVREPTGVTEVGGGKQDRGGAGAGLLSLTGCAEALHTVKVLHSEVVISFLQAST